MTALLEHLRHLPVIAEHRPWPRVAVEEADWLRLRDAMQAADRWTLLGLWAEAGEDVEGDRVHMALRDGEAGQIAVVSLDCPAGRFPSIAAVRPSAQRLERAIRDLFGLEPDGLGDPRPWLDHGNWALRHPCSPAPVAGNPGMPAERYAFLPVEGEGIHQVPVGPVHAGIIEPGHFRFHANGEAVIRLEERLGYVHKGTEELMRGQIVEHAARLAGRISGDSTVAHALAFARAVEAAAEAPPPPRADWLRALMAELERLANHFGDIGAICNDAAFAFALAHCSAWREQILRTAQACFGHRMMMDRIVPGGTAVDLSPESAARIRSLITELRPRFARMVAIYEDKPSLTDRTVATGIVSAQLVHRFGAGGTVGRASGRSQDARKSPSYPPYDRLEFEVPVRLQGDVDSRVWIRIREVEESFRLVEQILDRMPAGPVRTEIPMRAGEGMALVESFRGEILTWVRLDAEGRVARCHPRDPSWFQWPLLEAAIEGNIIADFPLCNKSFNCSYSGHDL
jgi:Ni,Fe-hydrogenase III large subunit/Ni,Fe-hydrogenase III component G